MVGSHWSAYYRQEPAFLFSDRETSARRARVFHRKTDLRDSHSHSGAKRLSVEGSVVIQINESDFFDEYLQSYCCSLARRNKRACLENESIICNEITNVRGDHDFNIRYPSREKFNPLSGIGQVMLMISGSSIGP